MKQNVGSVDKLVRLIVGLGLLSLVYVLEGDLRYLGLIGIVPIATAFVSFCPAYAVFGINTCCGGDDPDNKCCGGGSCDSKDAAGEDKPKDDA